MSGGPTSDPTRTITSLSAGLESLKSYRLRMGFSIDTKDSAGNHQTGTLAIMEDIDNEGRSLHASSQVTGNLNSGYGTSGFLSETYYLDGTTFLVDNGKCRFLSKKPFSGLAGSMILPDDYINSIGNAKLAGRGETLNEVSVDRYTIASATLGRQFKGMELSLIAVWIATDGYVVRLQGAAVGKDLYGSTASVVVIYDVDNINQPLGIKAPVDCVAP